MKFPSFLFLQFACFSFLFNICKADDEVKEVMTNERLELNDKKKKSRLLGWFQHLAYTVNGNWERSSCASLW